MKTFILSLLFLTYSYGIDIAFKLDEPKSLDSVLKKRFITYWNHLEKKNSDKMFQFEAPHFRYIYGFKMYNNYISSLRPIRGIEVVGLKFESENVINLRVKRVYQDGDTEHRVDRWIKLDGLFYHRAKSPFIFE